MKMDNGYEQGPESVLLNMIASLALCEGNPVLSDCFPSKGVSNAEFWYTASS